MLNRPFRLSEHRFVISLFAINTFIVVEEFARLYLSHPKFVGLGWYWTAALSFPSSLLLYVIHWPWPSELLSIVALLLLGAFQWTIIGTLLDRRSRTERVRDR
jgi:hypothetical protein